MKKQKNSVHPKGETKINELALNYPVALDTYAGKVHVGWDPDASVTPLGQLPFFIEFLKTGGVFDAYVSDCPLVYHSPNAPSKRDILGTLLLSILSGHTRYAHITSIRYDAVNPELLGMTKVMSEDASRRGLLKIAEEAGVTWLQRHLYKSYEPLLTIPWILDIDASVKPLYGHQEGAVKGYNPQKRGRPSHVYHSYMMANTRLILDTEVLPGNENAGCHSAPRLWSLIDALAPEQRPDFIRGDVSYGNEGIMHAAETRGVDYLFKLSSTKKVKALISEVMQESDWTNAGQGFEGKEDTLCLQGWSRGRRVVVLRRKLAKEDVGMLNKNEKTGQLCFDFAQVDSSAHQLYEYAVLVTSLEHEILTVAQQYRERGDSENHFDELKNQWGWCGFTTHDIKRCRLMSRMIALVYNWWNLFARFADPYQHHEAITTRPLLLHAVGRKTQHAGQQRLSITSAHRDGGRIKRLFTRMNAFFKKLRHAAEQLSPSERWRQMLCEAFRIFLQQNGCNATALPAPTG